MSDGRQRRLAPAAALIAVVAIVSAGCGQTGALVLPGTVPPAADAPAPGDDGSADGTTGDSTPGNATSGGGAREDAAPEDDEDTEARR